MTTVNGKILFLNEKNFNGKMLYSLKLADHNVLYMCGNQRPNAAKGDYVTFEAEDKGNDRMQVDVKSIVVQKAQVVTPQSGGSREAYWDKKAHDDKGRQNTIEYQAARNSAISAVGVILNAGAFKLPAKEADKYAAVVGLINDLTQKYYSETKTLGAPVKASEAAPAAAEEVTEEAGDWE